MIIFYFPMLEFKAILPVILKNFKHSHLFVHLSYFVNFFRLF